MSKLKTLEEAVEYAKKNGSAVNVYYTENPWPHGHWHVIYTGYSDHYDKHPDYELKAKVRFHAEVEYVGRFNDGVQLPDRPVEDLPLEEQVLVWRRRALTAERAKDFETEGRRAYNAGTPRIENPYRGAHHQWVLGWNNAKAADKAAMFEYALVNKSIDDYFSSKNINSQIMRTKDDY